MLHEADTKEYSAAHRGREFEFDITTDVEYYEQWYTKELLPVIKEKVL